MRNLADIMRLAKLIPAILCFTLFTACTSSGPDPEEHDPIKPKNSSEQGNQERTQEGSTQQNTNQQTVVIGDPGQIDNSGFGPGSNTGNNNIPPISSGDSQNPFVSVYSYLNSLRQQAGLIPLKENTLLQKAATNHVNYLVTNDTFGHNESNGLPGFTGEKAADRANAVNYLSRTIGEGIATGKTDKLAIDNLFSAIYHRFTLMNPNYDEIGIASAKMRDATLQTLVHNMGNSALDKLCQDSVFTGFGTFYNDVCKQGALDAAGYDQVINNTRIMNDDLIIWPPVNGTDIPPVFLEETPDPLSDYGVSGYPVSVVYNGQSTDTFTLQSFYLYQDQSNELISETRLLTEGTDPNNSFSARQFALFPLQRLDWNTRYRVEITYELNGSTMFKQWRFQTQEPAQEIIKLESVQNVFTINNKISTAIYIPPENPFDLLSSIKLSGPKNVTVNVSFYDPNTLIIQADSPENATITITLDEGVDSAPRVLTAQIQV